MINFKVNGNEGNYILNIPSSLDDITSLYLKNITDNVEVADNHSLVALCYIEKLSNIILASRQKKDKINAKVVPLFIKHGNTDCEFIKKLEIKNKLIIAGSDISMAYHVNIPQNIVSPELISKYTEGDGYAYQRSLEIKEKCFFLEFKLVPNHAIKGFYGNVVTEDYKDVFVEAYLENEN